MNPDELLKALRQLEIRLRSEPIQAFFKKQDEDTRARFVSSCRKVSVLVGKLSNAQLASIADRLQSISENLQAGIKNLQGKIDGMNNAAEILGAMDTVIRLASRVASSVV